MGRHSRRSQGKLVLFVAAAVLSVILGISFVTWGNHLAAHDLSYAVGPWEGWGAFFIAAPFLVLAAWVIAQLAKAAAAEHRRYKNWKASLPPEHRAAVEMAEAAALTAAAIAMHEHHKRADARLTESVMGRARRWRTYREISQGQPWAQQAPLQAGQQSREPQPLQPRIWQPPGQEP